MYDEQSWLLGGKLWKKLAFLQNEFVILQERFHKVSDFCKLWDFMTKFYFKEKKCEKKKYLEFVLRASVFCICFGDVDRWRTSCQQNHFTVDYSDRQSRRRRSFHLLLWCERTVLHQLFSWADVTSRFCSSQIKVGEVRTACNLPKDPQTTWAQVSSHLTNPDLKIMLSCENWKCNTLSSLLIVNHCNSSVHFPPMITPSSYPFLYTHFIFFSSSL